MVKIKRCLISAAVSTFVLSAVFVIKAMMGLMPELDMPKMIAGMLGAADQPAIGWAVHVMIGVVGYGLAFAALADRLPGRSRAAQGMMLAFGGWLIMMIMLMPMAGGGFFGMALGVMAPAMTLMLHLMFGAIVGGTYGWLEGRGASSAMAA
jgi:hypothetical protein